MGKIHNEIATYPLHGRIEVSEFQIREFLPDQFHELFYPHELTCIRYTDLSEVRVRIDLEISPLNHAQTCLQDQLSQRLILLHTVCHARKYKIIDGCPPIETVHYFR